MAERYADSDTEIKYSYFLFFHSGTYSIYPQLGYFNAQLRAEISSSIKVIRELGCKTYFFDINYGT